MDRGVGSRMQVVQPLETRVRECFGRESPHKVRFEAALMGRQDQHPATFFQILKNISNCFWTKKWYGRGLTARHGSDAPDGDV